MKSFGRVGAARSGSGQYRIRPGDFGLLATLQDGTNKLPDKRTLVHQVLKTIAQKWSAIVEYEQYYLAALPIHLKSLVLSYISLYGPDEGIDVSSLSVLFLNEEELEDGTGSEDLSFLDLTGLLGKNLTVADLERYCRSDRRRDPTKMFENLSLSSEATQAAPEGVLVASSRTSSPVLESWEDSLEISPSRLPSPPKLRFPCLTHLSLAYPGSAGSWASLLSLSKHLGTVTHLSLAYWPIPTVTPNARDTTMQSKHTSVAASGTTFYSSMDNDWAEASNILRRFSNNTYNLKWLDLEGCAEWLPALTWTSSNAEWPSGPGARRSSATDLVSPRSSGPDWKGSWSQIAYMNVGQGWIPRDVDAIRSLPSGFLGCQLLQYLRDHEGQLDSMDYRADEHVSPTDVRRWLERERDIRRVSTAISSKRRAGNGTYCKFNFGWEASVAKTEKESTSKQSNLSSMFL